MSSKNHEPPARAIDIPSRLPPHSLEGEQGVLGCILLNPQGTVDLCIETFKAGSVVFYDLKHRDIYDIILELHEERHAIDVIIVHERLKRRGQVESVGGLDYLAPLPDKVATSGNLEFYAKIVLEKYLQRRILLTCAKISERVYSHDGSIEELLDYTEREILAVGSERTDLDTGSEVKDLIHGCVNQLEEQFANAGKVMGIATGFGDLDKMIGGLISAEMTVLAAFPSVGKTSLAMNMAEAVALDAGLPVGVFSLEMSKEALTMRLLNSRARINMKDARDGVFTDLDYPRLSQSALELSKTHIHIDDTADMSIHTLRAKARRMWQQFGIRFWIVDYLQLLNATGGSRRPDNRQEEVAIISRGLKALARDTDAPVLVLSQLNDDGKLRESRAIGQDADGVWKLVRGKEGKVQLVIEKQRNGPRGTIMLKFDEAYTRFTCAPKIDPSDVLPPVNHGGQGGYTSDPAPAQQEF